LDTVPGVLKKKSGVAMTLLFVEKYLAGYFVFLSRIPAIPTKPAPKRSIVAGSGTGEASSAQRLKWDKPFPVKPAGSFCISQGIL